MYIASSDQLDYIFDCLYEQAKLLLDNGKKVDAEVKQHRQIRSSEQNNYYHLICSEVAKFLNDAGMSYGEHALPYTGELIHEINKKLFDVKTTTKLSISEFCQYMTKVIFFWQERTAGEYCPSELPAQYLERKGYTKEYMQQ